MRRAVAAGIVMGTSVWLTVGCGGPPQPVERQFSHLRLNLRFEFPEGWSRLSEREWTRMRLGENRTVITIMDQKRRAAFVLIEIPLMIDPTDGEASSGLDPESRLTQLLAELNRSGPRRYQGYRLIRMGGARFAGLETGVGEVVSEGKRPGQPTRWQRAIIRVPEPRMKPAVMLVFSAPVGERARYDPDFQFIEQTWRWMEIGDSH